MTHTPYGEQAYSTRTAVICWTVVMAGCVWFLAELLRAAERYPHWKWIVQ